MEYMEFVHTFIENLRDRTQMDERRIFFRKGDEMLKGDSIRAIIEEAEEEKNTIVYRIYSEGLFMEYQKYDNMGELLGQMAAGIQNSIRQNLGRKLQRLNDYETAKEMLVVRPVNYYNNQQQLQGTLYRRVGDIALSVSYKICEEEGFYVNGKCLIESICKWGKTEEDVFKVAMDNTMRLTPPRIYRWENLLFDPVEYSGEAFMREDTSIWIDRGVRGNCLSTTLHVNGSVSIFAGGVAKRLSDLMGGADLHLAFTSVHEVMVHNAEAVSKEDLELIVRAVIEETKTPKEDFLSAHIFRYIRSEDRIIMLPLTEEMEEYRSI